MPRIHHAQPKQHIQDAQGVAPAVVEKKGGEPARAPEAGDAFAMGGAAAPQAATPADAGAIGRSAGPFAKLAARGNFTGYITTASGQDVYVNVALGKDAARHPPVVMLDGIAARHDRNEVFANGLALMGQSIIQLYLPGQGETLLRDMEKGGKSLRQDITAEAQAKVVLETLDALGVKRPVGVAGLSYGGAIAAACKKAAPDRFSKVMLVAPFVESSGKKSPMYGMMMNNPFNPFGPMMYRAAAKNSLAQTFAYNPPVLEKFPGAFHEGLFRLSMGLEDFTLAEAVRGQKDVHFLVVPQDGASPPDDNALAANGLETGTFLMAPEKDAGKHDLVRGDPGFVAAWMYTIMTEKVQAIRIPHE